MTRRRRSISPPTRPAGGTSGRPRRSSSSRSSWTPTGSIGRTTNARGGGAVRQVERGAGRCGVDGKSRGAITNLFHSQRQFQLQAMALVREDPEVDVRPPDLSRSRTRWPGSTRSPIAESERGPAPRHGAGRRVRAELGALAEPGAVRRLERTDRRAEHARVPSLGRAAREFGFLPALARFALEVTPPWDARRRYGDGQRKGRRVAQPGLSREHPTRQRGADRRRDAERPADGLGWGDPTVDPVAVDRRTRRPSGVN